MLLFVVKAQNDQITYRIIFRERKHEVGHTFVDVLSIRENFFDGGATEIAATISGSAFANRVVVAIEKKSKRGIKNLVSGNKTFQDHLLEEPGGVRDVPFGW